MQSNYRLLIAFIALLLSSWALYQHFQPAPTQPSEQNTPLALFETTFKNLDNQELSLKQWQGKNIVLNFWAPWCPPCRDEMPELSHLQDQYKDQNVVVIGLAAEDVEKTQAYFKEDKSRAVSYAILIGDLVAMDLSEKLGNSRGILPYTVVIDANGQVVKTFLGRINQPLIEKSLLPLLNHSDTDAP